MKIQIEIDKNAGFCFGVVNAIKKAEETLKQEKSLYCIGDIVHNNMEVERLQNQGLDTIDHAKFKTMNSGVVLFRAHGEPPESYRIAEENNLKVVDATCPVVLNLQKKVKKAYQQMQVQNGQVVIYGKKGHAEVNGLLGQCGGDAIVVETTDDLVAVDINRPVILFSQTTKTIDGFKQVIIQLQAFMQADLKINDTICRKVANRVPLIGEFAQKHDVLIFVSGKKSSNGKLLFEICKKNNPNSFFISGEEEIKKEWFQQVKSVGVSGATSTPGWLMQQVADKIESLVG